MESKRRSIAKTCSWRFIATVVTFSVTYVMTTVSKGDLNIGSMAAVIALLDTSIKFGIYFIHERAWNKINYGREAPKPEFEI